MNSHFVSYGPALANHLWQSTAFAFLVCLLTLALRRNRARVRYALWLTASIKFLVPFSLLVSVGYLLPHPKQPIAPAIYSAMDVVEEPFVAESAPLVTSPTHVPTSKGQAEAVLFAYIGALWIVGFVTVLALWWNRWRVLSMSLHHAMPANEGREFEILRRLEPELIGEHCPVPLLLSTQRMEPTVFGAFHQVLVWPEQLSIRLEDKHIEAIVVHELTHVRRKDNLFALIHMLVEALFWFHPLVWWMGRQMVKEREQVCDEAVVESGRSPQTYAESLLKTCRFCIESRLLCVAGVIGADLRRRVNDIVNRRTLTQMAWPMKSALAMAGIFVLAVPVLLGQAKTAHRLMRAAIQVAPNSIRVATQAIIAVEPKPPIDQIEAKHSDSMQSMAFEVATIRRNTTGGPRRMSVSADGWTMQNLHLTSAIQVAEFTQSDSRWATGFECPYFAQLIPHTS